MKLIKLKFTFIELIVVLAVIFVLISILSPIISNAKQRARQVQCINNLRQIGSYAITYQMDNTTVMPASFGDTTTGEVNHWINYLIREGLNEKVFQCPSMTEDMMFDPAGHDPETGNIYKKASYIMNIISTNSWSGATLSSPKGKSSGWGTSSTSPVHINQVTNPANTIYITDSIGGISDSHSGINDYRRTDHGVTSTVNISGYVRWVGNHHEGGFNALFGDGRVERMYKSTDSQWVAVPNHE